MIVAQLLTIKRSWHHIYT